MSDEVKRMDLSQFPRRDLPKDDTLFFEDEESSEMFVLLAGSLGVFRNEVQVATIDEPLSLIGEMSALTHEPRNATVRALSFSKLVVVEDTEKLFADHSQMGAKLARLLAKRLAAMNSQFVEVKSKLARAMFSPPTGSTTAALPSAASAVSELGQTARMTEARVQSAIGDAAKAAAPTTEGAGATASVKKSAISTMINVDSDYKEEVFDALNTILDWDVAGT